MPDKTATLALPDGRTLEFPLLSGSTGPDVVDIRALYGKSGMFTYDPGFLIPQGGDEPLENQVEIQQAAPALPPEPLPGNPIHQTARLTSISLMWLIALVGLRPLGQTSTQFMMVWQRNRR